MNSQERSDRGVVTGKGLIGILATIIIVYAAFSFFPAISVPFNLSGETKEITLEFLRDKSSRAWRGKPASKKNADLKEFQKNIKRVVAKHLSGDHRYNEDDLEIEATIRSDRAKIKMPYTVVVFFMGMEFTFENRLMIDERAIQF